MSPKVPARYASSKLVQRLVFPLGGGLLAALAVLLLLPGAHAGLIGGFEGLGDEVTPEDRIPTYFRDAKVLSEDVDADGVSEALLLSAEAVMQLYAGDGALLWSRDYYDIADWLGVTADLPGQFMADFRTARTHLHTEHGQVFTDLDGDGRKELITSMTLYVDDPSMYMATALVKVNLTDGSVIDARLMEGVLRQIELGDFDGDGQDELFLGVEDGPAYGSLYTRGGNTTTRTWVEEIDTGRVLWQWDSGVAWARLFGVSTGTFDGAGTDIVFTVTEGFDRVYAIDSVGIHIRQDLVALDGATGGLLWKTPVADVARSLAVHDMDADGLDDVVVHIEEPTYVRESRGRERAFIATYRGLDGAELWSLRGMLGERPQIHGMELLPGTVPLVAFAYSQESEDGFSLQRGSHLELVNGLTGATVDSATLTQTLLPRLPGHVRIDDEPRPPETVTTEPNIGYMRLVAHDRDGDGDLDLVVGSKRGIIVYGVAATGLTKAWSDPHPVHWDNLFVMETADGAGVWSHGWYKPHGINPAKGDYEQFDEDVKPHRLFGFSLDDGTALADKPLFGMMNAVARIDLDGDGQKDRVMGGPGGTVFAMDGNGTGTRWTADVGDFVVDIVPTDLDRDGQEDLFVQVDDGFFGIRVDGTVLWQHDLLVVHPKGKIYLEDVRAADLNGDGVDDFAYSARSGYGAGMSVNPSRVGAVDGRTGNELWAFPATEPSSSFTSLALADFDGDGGPDVAYAVRHQLGLHYTIGVLDGVYGVPLWQVDDFAFGSSHVMNSEALQAADVDGDGAMDLLVLSAAGKVRMHDGATGADIGESRIETVQITGLQSLFAAPVFGPDEWGYVVVWNENRGQDSVLDFYHINGTHVEKLTHKKTGLLMSTRFADLDGDGDMEVLAGGLNGLMVLEPTALLNGTSPYLAHLEDQEASAFSVADIDGDGDDEFDYHPYDGYAPAEYDLWAFGDRHVRGMAVGAVDLFAPPDDGDGGGETPLPNEPPRASFYTDRTWAYPGEPFTFTSTSSDSDGTIVKTSWRFGDGTSAEGSRVTKSFSGPGNYAVTLTVTDDQNATHETTLTVGVVPDASFATRQSSSGTIGSPGATSSYTVTVFNTGRNADTYTMSTLAPADWSMTLDAPNVVTLEGETSHTWTVNVTVGTPLPKTELSVSVRGTPGTQQLSHAYAVPLLIDASLAKGKGPYHMLEDVEGELHLHWADGSAATGIEVVTSVYGQEARGSVVTDAEGRAAFTLHRDGATWDTGNHYGNLKPQVDGYGVYRLLPFRVGVV